MEHFYDQVLRRLRKKLAETSAVRENSTAADVLRALIGAQAWPEAFRASVEHSPEQAVSYLRERAKTEIKSFLRAAPTPASSPSCPGCEDLLIEAAGHGRESRPRRSTRTTSRRSAASSPGCGPPTSPRRAAAR